VLRAAPGYAWRYVALPMNRTKLLSAFVIYLATVLPVLPKPHQSEAARVLGICTKLYGPCVDIQRHLFAINEFYVLGPRFNARGRLVEVDVSPKYFFEEAHPDWTEPDKFGYLSKSQYVEILGQIDTIKSLGAFIKRYKKVSVVTNMTATHRETYRAAHLEWGEVIDLRRGENAPLLVRWIKVHYSSAT
jgi:hypothetical protein